MTPKKKPKRKPGKDKALKATAPSSNGTYSASDIQAVKTLLAKLDAKKAKALIDLMG